jgi:NAD+ synthase
MAKLREAAVLRTKLVKWLQERVEESNVSGVVFGLSGGIDSAVVCGLAAEALGPNRCMGLIMPIESIDEDAQLAQQVADEFRVPALMLDLKSPFQTLLGTLTEQRERAMRVVGHGGDPAKVTAPIVTESVDALARANLKPRLRMISLYYYANLLGYMVVGTGNRDEFVVGYFTKYGDGGADIFPLANMVKGEVRALAREIGVPAAVIDRPPSAGLWAGQTDEGELGFTYDQLDAYLIDGSSGDAQVDAKIKERERLSVHKVNPAPLAPLD